MKKKIIVILAFILVASSAFLFAGCSNKSVEASKLVIDEYYEACADYDADDIIELLYEDLIDSFVSEEQLEIILLSRIAVYGEIDEYKVVGTSYYKNNGEITVTLDMEVEYERSGETLIESFDLVNDGEDMLIANISHENEAPYKEIPLAFFAAYIDHDHDSLIELFSDAFFNYVTEDYLLTNIHNLEESLGNYKEYLLIDEWSYFSEIEEDDVIVIYEGTYNVSYDDGSIELTLQLCLEDDEIKIFDIFWSEE